ncbi:MAG: ribosomal protein S15 [Alectoria sarmentosa]|nr:MAG: ribosomal protein S15 [Alectoria sarmentosa]
MADADYNPEEAAELKKKRTFRKFSYRGIDLDQLLDLSSEQLRDVVHARARRRFNRGLKRKPMGLIKKLRKAKQEAKPNEKPDLVKTHLRNMIVVPEMIGSVIGIYSGKEFNQVEIKPEMVGFYLGEFSISYKPVKHGRPGIGATHSSRFIPLKLEPVVVELAEEPAAPVELLLDLVPDDTSGVATPLFGPEEAVEEGEEAVAERVEDIEVEVEARAATASVGQIEHPPKSWSMPE